MDCIVKLYISTMGLVMLLSFLQSLPMGDLRNNYFSVMKSMGPTCDLAKFEPSSLAESCGWEYSNHPGSFMRYVEIALEHQCDLVDPMRAYKKNHEFLKDEEEVDFVVVGAGTAGSIVAGRLASTWEQWKVALLEAGGPYPTGTMIPGSYFSYAKPGTAINWNLPLEPDKNSCLGHKNGQCHIPRGRVLGGTGALHGMMYMRGNPYDYNRWAEEGCEGWSYEDALPFFKKFENNIQIGEKYKRKMHGTSGPVTISQFRHHPEIAFKLLNAAKEMGFKVDHDLNGESQHGFTLAQATTQNGSRTSLYTAYIVPLLGKVETLVVSPHSHVTKILMNGTKAIGVEYMKNNKRFRVYALKEVIISAGALHSPQLLLLSGIGPEEHLNEMNISVQHNLPNVGKHLNNHLSYSVKFKLNEDAADVLNEESLFEYLHKRKGPLTSTGLSQVTGFTRVNELDGTPNSVPQIQMFFEGFLANCSHGDRKNKTTYITITPALLRPKSKGVVSLRSHEPYDSPKIQANYLAEEDDVVTLIGGIRFALDMSQTKALKDVLEIVIPPSSHCKDPFGSDAYWRCAIRYWTNPENHQCGTCRMGMNAEDSVVDTQLRVHGLDNLRVIDASIMPHVVSGNINGPIMMIAERGVQFIMDRWRDF